MKTMVLLMMMIMTMTMTMTMLLMMIIIMLMLMLMLKTMMTVMRQPTVVSGGCAPPQRTRRPMQRTPRDFHVSVPSRCPDNRDLKTAGGDGGVSGRFGPQVAFLTATQSAGLDSAAVRLFLSTCPPCPPPRHG